MVGERVPVAGVLPAVGGDLVRPSDAAGGENDRLRAKHLEAPPLAVVAERTDDAFTVLEQRDDGALHVHVDPAMHAVILQRADHLEPGAIAHVGEARIPMSAKVALEDAAIRCPVEERAPRL